MEGSGFYIIADDTIELNSGRRTVTITVANSGDRPVQVGSHAHFFEVNRALKFDRDATFGMRLDIPAGTAKRFEPGQEHTVILVEFGGGKIARGLNALVEGATDDAAVREAALRAAVEHGFVQEIAGT
jgi:urease beta subunit